ncbi:sulfotransferase 1C1-like [Cimex lectularius]|uniref:Sulfotransferase domain-containing protein n=1 Tax=Cimex lectularius TaxID=79782 RepID=A0A8I6RAZ0_CIMLE|nr:sulfotransferase 1C1-like [Cimex lectularius]
MDMSTDPTIALLISESGKDVPHAIYRIPPGKCLMPETYLDQSERIRNLRVRPDDVWVITYPKCGTTWTQEMVWLMMNDFDFDLAKSSFLYHRSVFLEFNAIGGMLPDETEDSITRVEKAKSPRVIKSHLPIYLLPKQLFEVKPKIIYVYRNPKDVAVSFFHHHQAWLSYEGSMDHFVQAFLEDKVLYGSFWENVLEYWEMRDEPNVLFNTYEEMKKDLEGVAKRTADFLNVVIPEDVKRRFLDHLTFNSMKTNESVNYEKLLKKSKAGGFMREGVVGSWKTALSDKESNEIDVWSRSKIANSNFPYNY